MISKLSFAAAGFVIGLAGAAQAGEGSVDSNNFGNNSYYGWNQPNSGWGSPRAYVAPGYGYGYSYAPRSYYDGDADVMTGYAVRSPVVEPDYDDDDQ